MASKIKNQVREKMAALTTAAFGLVAALAWNDTIKALFNHFLGRPDSPVALLIYAVLVTIIAVVATIMIGRTLGPE